MRNKMDRIYLNRLIAARSKLWKAETAYIEVAKSLALTKGWSEPTTVIDACAMHRDLYERLESKNGRS